MKNFFYKSVFGTLFCLFAYFTQISAQDAGVTTLITPADGSCGNATGRVKVIVYNYGSSSISNIPVQLKCSGSATFSLLDTLKKAINKGGQDTLTFSTSINTTGGGTYNFNIFTLLSGDVNNKNDALITSVTIYAVPDAPVGKGDTRCGGGPVTFKAPSTSKGSITKWYTTNKGGTAFASGDSVTKSIAATTTFYAGSVFGNGSDSLETNYKGSNNYVGIMFKVKPLIDMYITGFDVNPVSTAKDSIFFYYKAGDYAKYTTTPSAWTFGGKDAFAPSGSGTPNKVNIGGNAALQAGKEYSFYIFIYGGSKKSFLYQTAYKADDSDYNSSLIIHYGNGQYASFGGSNSPYYDQFNGGVYFNTNSCGSALVAVTGTVKEVVKSLKLSQNKTSKGSFNAGTSANPDEICVGDSLKYDLSAPSNFANSDYGSKWKMTWSLKTPKGSSTSNFNFTTPSAGTNGLFVFYPGISHADSVYTFMINAQNLSTGCDTTISRTIHVNAPVLSKFSVSNSCFGKALSLTNTSTPSGKISYLWEFGNNDTSSKAAPLYKYPSTGTYTINLSAYNAACRSTASQSVTVYNAPYGSVINKGTPFRGQYNDGDFINPDNVCLGDTNVYQLTPPKGLSNSDFGSKWIITSLTFKTPFGSTTKDTAMKIPSVTKNGTFSFFPTKNADSVFILTITLRTLPGNCDSVLTRFIHVRVNPTAYFSFTNACFGIPLKFKDSSNVSISSVSKWSWDFGDGSGSNLQNPTHIYAKAGVYKVTLSASTDVGCSAGISHNTEQYPQPAPDYSQVLSCNGNTSTFKDSSFIASGNISSWKWSFGDGSSATTATATHTFAKSGPYMVKLVTTSSFGCKDSVSRKITIMPNPVSSFKFKIVCAGTQMFFSNDAIDSLSPSTYLWDFGDGITSAAVLPTHIFTKNGTYNVSLKVTSKTGCSDMMTQSITPFSKPSPAFSNSAACAGLPVVFNDTSNAGSNSSYTWTYSDGGSETHIVPVAKHSFTKAGSYNVKLMIVNGYGCTDTASRSITVSEVPKAGFNADDVCAGVNTAFTNTSTGTGTLGFVWNLGDNSKTVTTKDVLHKYVASGSYIAKMWVINPAGCMDSVTRTVIVNPLPATPVWTSARNGYKVAFTPNDTTLSGYKWYFGTSTNDSSSQKKPVFQYPSVDAKYMVKLMVTNGNGCSSFYSDSVKVSKSGIDNSILLSDNILIYPNPFGGATQIMYHLNVTSEVRINVYDIEGRKIAVLRQGSLTPGDYKDIFDADKYQSVKGVYILKMIINDQAYTARMVKI